jgi:hypothetical protein
MDHNPSRAMFRGELQPSLLPRQPVGLDPVGGPHLANGIGKLLGRGIFQAASAPRTID